MSRKIERSYIDSLPPGILTFEAEEWGRTYDPENVAPVLTELASHKNAAVREGALLGLCHLRRRGYWSESIASVVAKALTDSVKSVRQTAEDINAATDA
jgi:hypothetical protein